MDIEQLKLILEMVKGTADSAVWLAVLYFFYPALTSIITILGFLLIIPKVFTGINGLIGLSVGPDMKEVRSLLGVGSPGPIVSSEREDIMREIIRLKELDKS